MQDFYSAKELAGVGGLPTTVQGVRKAALKLGWVSQKRQGTKALEYAFSSLPADVQITFRKAATKQLLTVNSLPETRKEVQLGMFETQQQALVADARKGVLNAINGLMKTTGYTQTKCAELLIDMARAEQIEPYMIAMLKSARDGRGRSSVDGLPSARSLLRFVERSQAGELKPVYRQKDMSVPAWAKEFLSYYASPEKPSVQYAHEQLARSYKGAIPSIYQVRRFLEKVGNVSREVGRMGSRELKTLRPFIRRGFDKLLPTDIYSADGHTFDAEVQHPTHGRPFRPEITTIIDIATRKVVGWSVDLAESALAVIDALRHSCLSNGIPAIFYVDNGSGYKNAMMSDPAIGLMARLGCEMTHSLPYNSQARGVIERVHQTLWVRGAKELPGYLGHDMDREARLAIHKLSRKAIAQGGHVVAMPLISWDQFVQFCAKQVESYNSKPHRSLAKFSDPVTGKQRHLSPSECWQQHVERGFSALNVTDDEARPLFRPQELRVVNRCEINLFNNIYFAPQLEEFHGEQIRVAFDIHDAGYVWLYNQEGSYLGTGELDGNKRDYMPLSFIERKRDERLKGREKRLTGHLEEARAERHGTAAITHDSIELPGLGVLNMNQLRARAEDIEHVIEADFEPVATATVMPAAPAPQGNSVPSTPDERWQLWNALDQQEHDLNEQGERIAHWFTTYPHSKEFIAFARRHGAAVASY